MTTFLSTPPPPPEVRNPDPAGDRPDHSRTGAVWVAATGAFLLLAAAAVFVAVRWQQLSDQMKLGILAGLTGGALLAGRRLRRALPATGAVIYHLGAFLLPVNSAAVLQYLDASWPVFLLVEGAVATIAWYGLEQVERSVLLRWSAALAAIVTAAGLSATLADGAGITVPAAVLVAALAVAGEALHHHREARLWALVAGFAPCLALAEKVLPLGTDALTTLGLAGSQPQLTGIVSGTLAAVVLGRQARRSGDLVLVVLAGAAAVLGLATTWVGVAPTPAANLVGAATLFLALEVTTHLLRRDPFWGAPARFVASGAEVIGAVAAVPLALIAFALIEHAHLGGQAFAGPALSHLVAGSLGAVAWFVADLRRRSPDGSSAPIALLLGGGWLPATLGITGSVLVGLALGTGSAAVTAGGAVVLAGLLVVSGRPGGHALAVPLVLGAPVIVPAETTTDLATVAGVSLAGGLLLASAAVVRAGMGDRDVNGPLAFVLAVLALVPITVGFAVLDAHHVLGGVLDAPFGPLALLAATALAYWTVALVLDVGSGHRHTHHLALLARLAVLAPLLLGAGAPPATLAAVAGLAALLAAADAGRRQEPLPLYGLVVALPVLLTTAGLAHHLPIGQIGVALCVLATVAAGVQLLVEGDWRFPLLGVVVASATAGVTLAATSVATASTALVVLGGIGLAYALVYRSLEGAGFAWLLVIAGTWGHLAHAEVRALDAYVAPVAFALVVAGWLARRRPDGDPASTNRAEARIVSSLVAYGPAIVLLGGSALLERLHGGGGAHALVAGAVGVAAVLAGGGRRLLGPLLLGTALLVTLTGHESLGVTREVPTWAWLGLGGTVLLAAGIAMERFDTGPLETGRRIVDVVSDRFT